jgi:sugar lactone lactonase YvrE
VASSGNNSIFGYSYAQLKAGGSPTPAITITSADLQYPIAMAFDVDGNLWVANSDDATVVEFSASQLATGGNINANVKLAPSSGITKPTGLAFDTGGNLWVANSDPVGTTSGVVAFTAAQLAASGTSAPAITVLFQNPSLTGGLAFDKSGGLWVSNAGTNSLVKYSSDQLTSSGTPTPATTISLGAGGSLNLPAALVFDPHAEGLPIR